MEEKHIVTIIVLNYNGKQFLEKCLVSLQNLSFPEKQYQILFVDNASKDGSVPFVRNAFPTISILEHPRNYGFCLGNNLAIQNCTSKYILLLNNDLHVHKDFLKNLFDVMESDSNIGCCGGDEYYYTDNVLVPKGNIRQTSWMGAGATIYRKEALEQSGLFDPTYFFYCEDVDISWRLKLKGWKIFQNETAIFYHAGKNRKVKITDKSFFYAWRNRIFLLMKFASLSQMRKSLGFYASLLLKPKRKKLETTPLPSGEDTHTNINEEQESSKNLQRHLLKAFFLLKLFFSVCLYTPEMLYKRYQLKSWITNHKEVDAWVDYIDQPLRNH